MAGAAHSGRVVVGVRPESFEDEAIVGERQGQVAVTAIVDVLESTGSDVYAHLSLNGHGPSAADEPLLRELAQATASEDAEVALAGGSELVARVGVSNSLTEGQEGRLSSTPGGSTCSTPPPADASRPDGDRELSAACSRSSAGSGPLPHGRCRCCARRARAG